MRIIPWIQRISLRLSMYSTIKGRGFSLSSDDIQLTSQTFDAAKTMFAAAKVDKVEGFILTSGYRSYEQQQTVYDARPMVAAEPGASEHGSGLAFDVTAYGNDDFTRTAQYKWLYQHCWDYGFILRYPADKTKVTGCPAESWHYRYVGASPLQADGRVGDDSGGIYCLCAGAGRDRGDAGWTSLPRGRSARAAGTIL